MPLAHLDPVYLDDKVFSNLILKETSEMRRREDQLLELAMFASSSMLSPTPSLSSASTFYSSPSPSPSPPSPLSPLDSCTQLIGSQCELDCNNKQTQKNILTDPQRHTLLSWMLKVCEHQLCQDEIFPLSTMILDKFLLFYPQMIPTTRTVMKARNEHSCDSFPASTTTANNHNHNLDDSLLQITDPGNMKYENNSNNSSGLYSSQLEDQGNSNNDDNDDILFECNEFDLQQRQLHLFAACSLLLATKLRQTPRLCIQTLIEFSRLELEIELTRSEIIDGEMLILSALKWDLAALVTPNDYLSLLIRKCKNIMAKYFGRNSAVGELTAMIVSDENTQQQQQQQQQHRHQLLAHHQQPLELRLSGQQNSARQVVRMNSDGGVSCLSASDSKMIEDFHQSTPVDAAERLVAGGLYQQETTTATLCSKMLYLGAMRRRHPARRSYRRRPRAGRSRPHKIWLDVLASPASGGVSPRTRKRVTVGSKRVVSARTGQRQSALDSGEIGLFRTQSSSGCSSNSRLLDNSNDHDANTSYTPAKMTMEHNTSGPTSGANDDESRVRRHTQSLLELCLMDSRLSQHSASILAMATMAVAIDGLSSSTKKTCWRLNEILLEIHQSTDKVNELEQMIEVAFQVEKYVQKLLMHTTRDD